MHFIEDWFGISPDGGNGMLEAAYMVLALLIVGTLGYAIAKRFRPVRARGLAPHPTGEAVKGMELRRRRGALRGWRPSVGRRVRPRDVSGWDRGAER
jgi:hypothetical protein